MSICRYFFIAAFVANIFFVQSFSMTPQNLKKEFRQHSLFASEMDEIIDEQSVGPDGTISNEQVAFIRDFFERHLTSPSHQALYKEFTQELERSSTQWTAENIAEILRSHANSTGNITDESASFLRHYFARTITQKHSPVSSSSPTTPAATSLRSSEESPTEQNSSPKGFAALAKAQVLNAEEFVPSSRQSTQCFFPPTEPIQPMPLEYFPRQPAIMIPPFQHYQRVAPLVVQTPQGARVFTPALVASIPFFAAPMTKTLAQQYQPAITLRRLLSESITQCLLGPVYVAKQNQKLERYGSLTNLLLEETYFMLAHGLLAIHNTHIGKRIATGNEASFSSMLKLIVEFYTQKVIFNDSLYHHLINSIESLSLNNQALETIERQIYNFLNTPGCDAYYSFPPIYSERNQHERPLSNQVPIAYKLFAPGAFPRLQPFTDYLHNFNGLSHDDVQKIHRTPALSDRIMMTFKQASINFLHLSGVSYFSRT